jgi:hypothetical protein
MRHLALMTAIVLSVALAPRLAAAASGDPAIIDNWARMDKCYKDSFDKFPDFTKEAEIARQRFVRKCQVQYSLNTSRPLILRH